ncbi:MAG: hypothetical protein RIS17_1275 [Pseudomonadota bacterium]
MAVPLVIIRPEPGCSASVNKARKMHGVEVHGFPLFEVVARSWEAVPPEKYDALLIGSAMVLRHGGPGLSALKALPVYAVGDVTADAARDAGFTVVATGTTNLQTLLGELAPDHRRLLRLAGEERVTVNLPKGVTMDERVVYASLPRPMSAEMIARLHEPAIVTLHSAEAARHLAAECVRHGIRRASLRLAALSSRIAAAAGDGWGEVASVPYPDDTALLALARQMCQDPLPGAR